MRHLINIIALSLFCLPAQSQDKQVPKIDELTSAYQREILFLSTYKKELKTKLSQLHTSLGGNVKAAEKELRLMEKKWLNMQTSNELLMKKFTNIERDYDQRKENKDLLEITLQQANLKQGRPDKKDKTPVVEQMRLLFLEASSALNKSRVVTKSSGVFYLKNGEETKGTLFQVGSVAKFAEKDGKIAALYPSGSGAFRVWKWLGEEASVLKEGSVPENFQFFMFSNPNAEFVAQKEKTVFDVLKSGGLIGWIIVVMGLFALGISAARFVLLKRASCRNFSSLESFIEKIRKHQMEDAQNILLKESSAVSRVLNKTLSYLKTEPEKVEDAILEAILNESQVIDRFGVVTLVIASVAPLMGLLGTVTGMISTFDIITLYGTGNPKLLSGGISEALVTTMLGLIVAIPALLIGQYLNTKNEAIKVDMEKWALATCNAFKNGEGR